jgi:hypothetical protein
MLTTSRGFRTRDPDIDCQHLQDVRQPFKVRAARIPDEKASMQQGNVFSAKVGNMEDVAFVAVNQQA